MCNINAIFRTRNYMQGQEDVLTSFLMSASAHSFINNSDSEGLYCDKENHLVKSLNKINLFESFNQIKNSKVIITHQRLSTSGHTIDYAHPFMSDNFVLVHNGIINDFLKSGGSDTHGFFIELNEKFNELKEEQNREERIIKTIKELLDKKIGSYSIILYDKISKVAYYFKNYMPNIYFYRNDKCLFITTNNDNFKFVTLLDGGFSEKKIKDYKIYKITIEEESISIEKIGNIEKPDYSYNNVWGNVQSSITNYNINSYEKYNSNDIKVCSLSKECFYCGELTFRLHKKLNQRLCINCQEKAKEQEEIIKNNMNVPDYV